MELKEQMVLKEFKVDKVLTALTVLMVLRELRERKEQLAHRERKVLRGYLEQAHKEQQEFKEQLVQ
jgi:hypothetical protein